MKRETVEEFVARGGQIQQIPIGMVRENVDNWKWVDHSLPLLSKPKPQPNRPNMPYFQPKPIKKQHGGQNKGTGKGGVYLEYIKKHPGAKPRHVATALGWSNDEVRNARKTCIKNGSLAALKEAS